MIKNCLILLSCLALSACGYTFQGGGSVLPPDIKVIAIPMVQNASTESSLTTTVTEALRDRFERYGVVTVVEDLGEADAILKARIVKVTRNQRTSTSRTDTELQLDTVLTLAAELRRVTGPVLWRDNNISVSKAFGTTSDVVVTTSPDFASGTLGAADLGALNSREVSRGQEQDALRTLADEAARQIYDSAVAPDF
jgi:outer membrane lipopolysaccharide assembly protein LptE/RlpB